MEIIVLVIFTFILIATFAHPNQNNGGNNNYSYYGGSEQHTPMVDNRPFGGPQPPARGSNDGMGFFLLILVFSTALLLIYLYFDAKI